GTGRRLGLEHNAAAYTCAAERGLSLLRIGRGRGGPLVRGTGPDAPRHRGRPPGGLQPLLVRTLRCGHAPVLVHLGNGGREPGFPGYRPDRNQPSEVIAMKQVLSVLIFSLCSLSAQETRGTIFGRVLDQQSAIVAGAQVSLTNLDT